MYPAILLVCWFISGSTGVNVVGTCDLSSSTLEFEPANTLISVIREDNVTILFAEPYDEYRFRCFDVNVAETRRIRLEELSFANSVNYERLTISCLNCRIDFMVVDRSDPAKCDSNGTIMTCGASEFMDQSHLDRGAGFESRVKYSYYDSIRSRWRYCEEYDDKNRLVDERNSIDFVDTAVIKCPFNVRDVSEIGPVLVRMEEIQNIRVGVGLIRLSGPQTSTHFTYFTVEVNSTVAVEPYDDKDNDDNWNVVVVVVISVSLCVSLIILVVLALGIRKRYFAESSADSISKDAHSAKPFPNLEEYGLFYYGDGRGKERVNDFDAVATADYAGDDNEYDDDNDNGDDDDGGGGDNGDNDDNDHLRRKKIILRQMSGDPDKINPGLYLNQQATMLQYDSRYEISRDRFVVGRIIGSGNFGHVYEGEAYDLLYDGSKTKVAVKTVTDALDTSQLTALLCEIKILSKIEMHLSLVSIWASCASGIDHGELYLLLEYCPYGDMKTYLIQNRSKFLRETSFSWRLLLLEWSYSVAKGMEYLSSKRIMHGDLAARNILIGNDFVAKVSDFGLSKTMYDKYRYKKTQRQYVPWKWMAIEYLRDACFHINSDVWSYGVVLWEIFTFGREPYMGEKIDRVVEKLRNGYRLDPPEFLENVVWGTSLYEKLMKPCWIEDPSVRMNFKDVVRLFESTFLTREESQKYSDQFKRLQDIKKSLLYARKSSSYVKVASIDDKVDDGCGVEGYITVQTANDMV